MRKYIFFLVCMPAFAGHDLTFMWDSPTDTTGIEETRIYQDGIVAPIAVAPMPFNQITINLNLPRGNYCYFATHANAILESDASNVVCITMPMKPNNLKVQVERGNN